VGDTGIEPVTSSVSGKRATAAPIAQCIRRCGGRDGADDRIRTGDPHLGKVMLYQLSYVRTSAGPTIDNLRALLASAQMQMACSVGRHERMPAQRHEMAGGGRGMISAPPAGEPYGVILGPPGQLLDLLGGGSGVAAGRTTCGAMYVTSDVVLWAAGPHVSFFESARKGGRRRWRHHRAIGAGVARFLHTEEVTGSIPVSPTTRSSDPRRADVAQLVEHHLAKVRVAGSNPVVRSGERRARRPVGSAVSYRCGSISGGLAERRGNGLQSRVHGFESRTHLRRCLRVPPRAIGAAVARFPDTEEVTGSIPVSPTSTEGPRSSDRGPSAVHHRSGERRRASRQTCPTPRTSCPASPCSRRSHRVLPAREPGRGALRA